MLDHLDSHLDNIAMAATNKKEVLVQLAANNAKLTNLVTTQLGRIEQLLKARPSTATAVPNPANTSNPSDGKNFVFQLRHSHKSKWVVGVLCSTHGWGTSHSSPNCPRKS